MRKILVIFFTLISVISSAQILDPVSWIFTQNQLSDTEVELQFKASIEDHWHLYSQHLPEGVDAYPTEFIFITNEGYQLVEGMIEPEPIREIDPQFDNIILPYFEEEVVFRQKIKVTSGSDFKIDGEISFMSCDESQCVFPPVTPFFFEIEGAGEYVENSIESGNQEPKQSKGLWMLFFIAFFSGFAALLTPCVFPLIPMTVSFFTKKSKTKAEGIANAIIYGFSIIIIYVSFFLKPIYDKHNT